MDHKRYLASLPDATKVDLTTKADRAGLVHLAGHLAPILAIGAMIALRVPFWPLLMPVQGVLICFLFTLEHECTHKTPFRSPWLNEWIGRGAGFLILLPFEWFRYFHLAHHRFTNLPGQDPELDGPRPETAAGWLWHLSGMPYWQANVRLVIRLCLGRERAPYLPASALPRMEREARIMVALWLFAGMSLLATPLLLGVWILPVLLGQPFLRLYLLAEHGDCPTVANMFENTRTTFTNRIVRFLAWNMPYHVEHHVMPQVPFHHLPGLHRLMRADLKVTAAGYAAFARDFLARRM